MSTFPISSSSGLPPAASLPEETPADEQGAAAGPEIVEVDDYQPWSPRGAGFAGSQPQSHNRPLGPTHGNPGNGGTPNSPGNGNTPAATPNPETPNPGNGNQTRPSAEAAPGTGRPRGDIPDAPPRPGTTTPGNPPGTGPVATPGQNNPGNNPGNGWNNGQGQGNGWNGHGNNAGNPGGTGMGNGFGLGQTIGATFGNIANGLIGRGGVLAAPLEVLNGNAQGGLGNVLSHATPIPQSTPAPSSTAPSSTPANPATPAPGTPNAASTTVPTATPSPTAQSAPGAASTNMSQAGIARVPNPTQAQPTTAGTAHATTQATTQAATQTAAQVNAQATPVRGAVAEPTPMNTAAAARGGVVDPAHVTLQRGGTGAANEAPHAQTQNGSASSRQPGNPVQALAPSTSVLTLMVAPHAELTSEEARATTNSALFREQGTDGRENVRDILGRSFVYTADGKLITRAQERTGVDAVDPTQTKALDEVSMANHGELSTHDLLFKVVAPAFAGMAALLGGATAGAGIATGTSGMGGSFLLVAASAVLGYGTARAVASLRELATDGADLNPLSNRTALIHWVAAGTQSTGSLAALAMLLF